MNPVAGRGVEGEAACPFGMKGRSLPTGAEAGGHGPDHGGGTPPLIRRGSRERPATVSQCSGAETQMNTEGLFGAKKFLAMRMRERTHLDATPIAAIFVESVAVETPSNTVVTVFSQRETGVTS